MPVFLLKRCGSSLGVGAGIASFLGVFETVKVLISRVGIALEEGLDGMGEWADYGCYPKHHNLFIKFSKLDNVVNHFVELLSSFSLLFSSSLTGTPSPRTTPNPMPCSSSRTIRRTPSTRFRVAPVQGASASSAISAAARPCTASDRCEWDTSASCLCLNCPRTTSLS